MEDKTVNPYPHKPHDPQGARRHIDTAELLRLLKDKHISLREVHLWYTKEKKAGRGDSAKELTSLRVNSIMEMLYELIPANCSVSLDDPNIEAILKVIGRIKRYMGLFSKEGVSQQMIARSLKPLDGLSAFLEEEILNQRMRLWSVEPVDRLNTNIETWPEDQSYLQSNIHRSVLMEAGSPQQTGKTMSELVEKMARLEILPESPSTQGVPVVDTTVEKPGPVKKEENLQLRDDSESIGSLVKQFDGMEIKEGEKHGDRCIDPEKLLLSLQKYKRYLKTDYLLRATTTAPDSCEPENKLLFSDYAADWIERTVQAILDLAQGDCSVILDAPNIEAILKVIIKIWGYMKFLLYYNIRTPIMPMCIESLGALIIKIEISLEEPDLEVISKRGEQYTVDSLKLLEELRYTSIILRKGLFIFEYLTVCTTAINIFHTYPGYDPNQEYLLRRTKIKELAVEIRYRLAWLFHKHHPDRANPLNHEDFTCTAGRAISALRIFAVPPDTNLLHDSQRVILLKDNFFYDSQRVISPHPSNVPELKARLYTSLFDFGAKNFSYVKKQCRFEGGSKDFIDFRHYMDWICNLCRQLRLEPDKEITL